MLMHLQKVRIGRHSKKLHIQGAQFLKNETTLQYAEMGYLSCFFKSHLIFNRGEMGLPLPTINK